MAVQIPLSQITSAAAFAKEVDKHCAALKKHQMGKPGVPAPAASPLVSAVIARQPQTGPVAKRGPDDFVILDYEFLDDLPKPQEVQEALSVLRETIDG